MLKNQEKVLCLMGPTASGKTQMAIDWVIKGGYEIISVDSAMIYQGMDIGTAMPSQQELQHAPHRLIRIRDPAAPYSVGEFCEDALREIDLVIRNGHTPLLVGGTMMYFYQLQNRLSHLPTADVSIREQIANTAQALGWPALHTTLQTIDPLSASQLHPHDAQRISRALEIFYQTGKPLSVWHQEQTRLPSLYHFENIILAPQRQVIHERIEKRFDNMLEHGFLDEVQALYQRQDLHKDLPSMRSVGYRQAWEYLEGTWDKTTMRDKAIVATRQLCKRQFTWLRRWQDATWIE